MLNDAIIEEIATEVGTTKDYLLQNARSGCLFCGYQDSPRKFVYKGEILPICDSCHERMH